MGKEIIIVTAFFDIGRENFKNCSRSSNQYFEYFKFWARIKNRMVIYCQPQNYTIINKIRSDYGLSDVTKIKVIEDIYKIEPEIFSAMSKIEKNNSFKNFRYYNEACSNRADYDYVVLLKSWCMQDAASTLDKDKMIAWVDFGYNHGNAKYLDSNDFDFYWEYDFPDKINLFSLSDPNLLLSIDSLQFQKDCMIGGIVVLPQYMCSKYWQRMKTAMWSLISLDCIDDEQQLQLMIYKLYKEDFSIIICDWFDPIEICSNQHFTIKDEHNKKMNALETQNVKRKINPFDKIRGTLSKVKWRLIEKIYISSGNAMKRYSLSTRTQDFLKRMEEKSIEYYN